MVFLQSSPMRASSSLLQTMPAGFWGLHKIISVVSGWESFSPDPQINRVTQAVVNQGIFQCMPALVFNGVKEYTVNGRLYHHIVSHIGHPLYGTGNRRNDAGTEDQPLFSMASPYFAQRF